MKFLKDWNIVQIGDIASVRTGGTPDKSKSEYWMEGTIPWVTTTNVNFCRIKGVNSYITETAVANSSTSLFPKNTLLMAMYGQGITRGRVAILDLTAAINQACAAISIHEGHSLEFIFYCLQWKYEEIREIGHGGNQKNLNLSLVKSIKINLPPLEQQKAIASILSTWDEAIEKTEQLIVVKKRILDEIRQKILKGKIRLEGFNKPWKLIHLSEVMYEHKELSSGFEEVYSVSVHKGLINQIEHLGRSFAASNTNNYNVVKPGDVVYTKSPTGDFPYGIIKQSKLNYKVLVSPLYGVFTPKTFELGAILDTIFESKIASQNYLRPLIQKGAKNTINITNTMFLSGTLYLPLDYEEQKKIFELINCVRSELNVLNNLKEKYIKQKQGLMQKLFTGKWRVNFKEEK